MAKVREKRGFNRWELENEKSTIVSVSNFSEDTRLLDISVGGMKITFSKPIKRGAEIIGKFDILPSMGPFFGKGKVIRVREMKGEWEVAVKFDRVSAIPLTT